MIADTAGIGRRREMLRERLLVLGILREYRLFLELPQKPIY
jgi:hypothetical protein